MFSRTPAIFGSRCSAFRSSASACSQSLRRIAITPRLAYEAAELGSTESTLRKAFSAVGKSPDCSAVCPLANHAWGSICSGRSGDAAWLGTANLAEHSAHAGWATEKAAPAHTIRALNQTNRMDL